MIYEHMLREFHRKFGYPIGDAPAFRDQELRANLIEEEAKETVDAIRRGDMVEAVDGMCDLLYVVFGTATSFGVDIGRFFAEVHRTNMLKEGGARRADNKILKPPGWQPPRIKEMLSMATSEAHEDMVTCLADRPPWQDV